MILEKSNSERVQELKKLTGANCQKGLRSMKCFYNIVTSGMSDDDVIAILSKLNERGYVNIFFQPFNLEDVYNYKNHISVGIPKVQYPLVQKTLLHDGSEDDLDVR